MLPYDNVRKSNKVKFPFLNILIFKSIIELSPISQVEDLIIHRSYDAVYSADAGNGRNDSGYQGLPAV